MLRVLAWYTKVSDTCTLTHTMGAFTRHIQMDPIYKPHFNVSCENVIIVQEEFFYHFPYTTGFQIGIWHPHKSQVSKQKPRHAYVMRQPRAHDIDKCCESHH
jgi:hypothetical protein